MLNRYLIFAAFVSLPLLSGCATNTVKQAESEQTELLDRQARDALQDIEPAFPASVIRTPNGPTDLGGKRSLPPNVARSKWQEDRDRLRTCVATHEAIVSEMTVRGIIKEMKIND